VPRQGSVRRDAVDLEGLLMTDRTILAVVLRYARAWAFVCCFACLAFAFSAPYAVAGETVFPAILLYPGYYAPNDYVEVVLHYQPVVGGFQYTYVVTNHSSSNAKLSRFFFTSAEVSDLNTFGDWQPPAESGWGHWGPQGMFIYGVPFITNHEVWDPDAGKFITGSQFRWDASNLGVALAPGASANFGFTSTYDISQVAADIANAYVVAAYSNGADLLYGPDPNASPSGGQVPEWSSIMLGLIGLGGMGLRFRRR
jgi:hypothetical protein